MSTIHQLLATVWMTCAALVIVCTSAPRAAADEPLPTISVSGTAKVLVAPDQAILQASVVSRFATLEDAVMDNHQAIERVLTFLRDSGVESKHIRTARIAIAPIWLTRDGRYATIANSAGADESALRNIQPIGYTASRQFQITIVDLEKFETLYEGLLKNGVNDVSSLEFISTELRQHRDEARLQAVRAAREKAVAMAEELGASVVGVKSIVEAGPTSSSRAQNVLTNAFVETEGGQSLAAGQMEISATVNVVFYLENGASEVQRRADQP